MKRINIYTLAPLALLLGLAACTREESGMLPDGTQPLTLTAYIEGSTTMRSTVNNTWDGGETIALQVDSEDWYEYTVDASGNMTGDYYWQGSNSITVQGLYPASVVEEGVEDLTWSVESDQRDDNYQSGDLLASDLQTVSYGSTANLAFYHQTAKVVVNIKDVGLPTVIGATTEDISLTLGDDNLVLNGTFTLPTEADNYERWLGTWEPGTTNGTTTGSIKPHSGTAATGCIATYEALVIPQTVESGTQLLTITLTKDDTDYGTFLYTLAGATEWSAGYVYTYNVSISPTLELEVSISTDIDWNTGTGGTGSVTMPPDYEIVYEKTYIVYTAEGLLAWNQAVQDDITLNCTLARDINLTDIDYEWLQVGDSEFNRYTGTFEGGDHTITGLTINQSEANYMGLIGYLGSGGVVQNLTLDNVSITGQTYVGGVVGYSRGSVTNCSVSGSVSGYNNVGGVVGYHYWGTVIDCHFLGDVDGNRGVGGVVGYNQSIYTYVFACTALGNVTGTGNYVGGVVGSNYGANVTACYHTSGNVSGSNYVGGAVGYNIGGTTTACYHASGNVSGSGSDVGGAIGFYNSTVVTACYYSYDETSNCYLYDDDSSSTTWSAAYLEMNEAIDAWNQDNTDNQCEWKYELSGSNTWPTLKKNE